MQVDEDQELKENEWRLEAEDERTLQRFHAVREMLSMKSSLQKFERGTTLSFLLHSMNRSFWVKQTRRGSEAGAWHD